MLSLASPRSMTMRSYFPFPLMNEIFIVAIACGRGCARPSVEDRRDVRRQGHALRKKSIVQLVSHVAPASGENACSHLSWSAPRLDHRNRILIGLPWNVSSA